MIFIIRGHNDDVILDGYAVNTLGIKQIIHNSLHYQYEDYDRIEVRLQDREAVVKYKFLSDLHFDIILLEQVVIEND
jgi:hypothetical protein